MKKKNSVKYLNETALLSLMTPSPPTDESQQKKTETAQNPREQLPEFSYIVKIPRDRVAVIIGPKGATKRQLQNETKVKIDVDSKEGDITLTGKDSLALFTLKEVIRAIGRGFNPDLALLLLKQDYVLEVIQIGDFSRNKNDLVRLRGRLIGSEGKARVTIENLTDTYTVVYGKTCGIIGTTERCILAKRAFESLLEGSPHANVYKWLEKSRRKLTREEHFQ